MSNNLSTFLLKNIFTIFSAVVLVTGLFVTTPMLAGVITFLWWVYVLISPLVLIVALYLLLASEKSISTLEVRHEKVLPILVLNFLLMLTFIFHGFYWLAAVWLLLFAGSARLSNTLERSKN